MKYSHPDFKGYLVGSETQVCEYVVACGSDHRLLELVSEKE